MTIPSVYYLNPPLYQLSNISLTHLSSHYGLHCSMLVSNQRYKWNYYKYDRQTDSINLEPLFPLDVCKIVKDTILFRTAKWVYRYWLVRTDGQYTRYLHTIQLTWSQSTDFTNRRCATSVNDSTQVISSTRIVIHFKTNIQNSSVSTVTRLLAGLLRNRDSTPCNGSGYFRSQKLPFRIRLPRNLVPNK